MQNNLNIPKVFFGTGTILCVAAIVWWAKVYGEIVEYMGDSLSLYTQCLINPGGECEDASYFVQQYGITPYSPYLLWAGILLMVIGFLIKQSPKPSE